MTLNKIPILVEYYLFYRQNDDTWRFRGGLTVSICCDLYNNIPHS
jgi:hypothetical protein